MKNTIANYRSILFVLFSVSILNSCTKTDQWLDKKSDNSDVVPASLRDMQAILDYDVLMNNSCPSLGLLSADQYYLKDATYNSLSTVERNSYTWKPDIFEGSTTLEWTNSYKKILYANIVLEGLDKINIDASQKTDWNRVKGGALFFRAHAFYQLLQVFAPPYTESSASVTPGIPLRLSSDIHAKISRQDLQTCYNQLNKDLQQAASLLPDKTEPLTRATRTGALALLAKIALLTGNYPKAKAYADTVLQIQSNLLDLNTLSATPTFSFPSFQTGNPEIIFYTIGIAYSGMVSSFADSLLYRSYAGNDLRRTLFFKLSGGLPQYRGSYSANYYPFAGLSVNEILLIRAECNARAGNTADAMADLNTLLVKRWKKGTFIPLIAATNEIALQLILTERKKELAFNGCSRWEDLRRLNTDPAKATTLYRKIGNESFTLSPNDLKYTFPIPDIEIKLSGLIQNPR